MKKIIAFSGSNSKVSINQRLVNMVAEMITECVVEVIDLRDYPSPLYGIDLENEAGIPENMLRLKSKLREADGFLVSSPEHNGAMPAFLKNAIDWLSRIDKKVFDDKPVVFMSTSPGGRGGKSALENLVAIMPHRGANVVGSYSLGSFNEKVENEQLVPSVQQEIKEVLKGLVKAV